MSQLMELYFQVYPTHVVAEYHKFASACGIGIVIKPSDYIARQKAEEMAFDILYAKIKGRNCRIARKYMCKTLEDLI